MKESVKVVTTDGMVLSATRFIPNQANGKVVLINSATAVKQRFYEDFAAFLSREGFYVYTYDYRGIGDSRPVSLTGFNATMEDWGILDYTSLLQHILETHRGSRIVVIGHSIGGQLIGFSPLSSRVDSFVTIGAQTPYWKNYEGWRMRLKLFVLWYFLIPSLTRLVGFFPARRLGIFEDLPAGVAAQWSRWAKNSNYVFDELPGLRQTFSELNQPALMVSLSDDKLAPLTAVIDLMSRFSKMRWNHWALKPDDVVQQEIGHFGFFSKRMLATLWSETVSWIQKESVRARAA